MKIATWNINSIRMRMPRLLNWLATQQPDILCLQETKVVDEQFPLTELTEAGYHCSFFGQKSYNGVAILSRQPAAAVVRNLPDDDPAAERRLLAATIEQINIINVYAPNGAEVGSTKYSYKLDWYQRLRTFLDQEFNPTNPVLICGDFNIAPEDRDVWDVRKWQGQILFSEPEKAALKKMVEWGFEDTLRKLHTDGGIYTWWDYRMGAFNRNWGLRIDHIFATAPLAARCREVTVDREARKGEKPSDHAPVVAIFD